MSKSHPHKMKIFFDESGKDKDYPNLMGAVLIPTACYELDSLNHLQDLIKEGKKPIHWTGYTGDGTAKRRIITLIEQLMVYHHLLNSNVTLYEWNEAQIELTTVTFANYLNVFLSTNLK